jgi:hypothetical protein
MQIPHQDPYAKTGTDSSGYSKYNKGRNNIGDGGLLHLSKGTWERLINLMISFNWGSKDKMRMGRNNYLMRVNWRSLWNLNIG